MRKLEIPDADTMRIAVQEEILRTEQSRYQHRLHGILLICAGWSCTAVAELFGHSPRTVQYWGRRFETHGFAGLEETPRPGRPSVLDARLWRTLGRDLRRPPRELGYAQTLWDGKLLSHHLAENLGVPLGVRQCQRVFHQLGFRRRKPRPVLAGGDPEAQAQYKKTPAARRPRRS